MTDGESVSREAVAKIFRASGLAFVDRLDKETCINASMAHFKEVTKNEEKATKILEPIFGGGTRQVIADIQNGVFSDDVKFLLFSEICNFQPLTAAETPEGYLKAGNGRIVYQLKTWMIKTLDVYRNEVIKEMQTDPAKGLQNFIKLTAALVAVGITVDEVKDFIFGRVQDLSDYAVNNTLKIIGLNRYSVANIQRDGPLHAAVDSVIPWASLFDDLYTDVSRKRPLNEWKTARRIPVVGGAYYWWLGGGKNKTDRSKFEAR